MRNKKERFDFVAYMSPPPADAKDGKKFFSVRDFMTEEHYRNVRECGFNRLSAIYEHTEEQYLRAMSFCDLLGLEYVVREQVEGASLDDIVEHFWENPKAAEKELSRIEHSVKARIERYAEHPSFVGILGCDEPHIRKFSVLKLLCGWMKENFPDKEFEVNLLPDYASGEQLTGAEGGEKNYREYVDAFIRSVEPQVLSYDHYALMIDRNTGKTYIRDSYLENLQIMARQAQKFQISFRVFLLTLGHWSFRTVSSYREIAWQVYTAMAYGATGAQTFTYWTMLGHPPGNPENVTGALVSAEGELLPAWYAMREVIGEVRFFEREYLCFSWEKCLWIVPEKSMLSTLVRSLEQNTDARLIEIDADAELLIGCFSDGRRRAYLLSNLSDPAEEKEAKAEITFDCNYEGTIYQGGRKERFQTEAKKFRVLLRSGEGAFLILEKRRNDG